MTGPLTTIMPASVARRGAVPLVALGLCLLLAACASQSGEMRQDTFVARKKLVRELMSRGEWATAFAYANDLHRERPKDGEVLVLRGTIYRERGLWADSEGDLSAALQTDDRSPEAHAALGILYDVTSRAARAEAEHRAAVKLAPNNPAYLNNLGFSLFLRGKHKESIGFYQQAARLEPTSRRVRTNLGFAYAASGDLPRAAHEFDMGGTPAEAKNNLGFAYERRGDLHHAFDLYLEATRLDPKSAHARSNLVHAAQALGREVPPEPVVEGAAPETPAPAATGATPAPLSAPEASAASAAPAAPTTPSPKREKTP